MPFKTLKPFSKTSFRILSALALAVGGTALINTQTQAAVVGPGTVHSVTLAWDAVPEPDIQGYKVHVGTQPGQYTQTLDAGTDLSHAIDNLAYGQTYYFSVRAVDSTGLESGYSPELTLTVTLPQLPATTAIAANGNGLQWSYPKTALSAHPDFNIESSTDLVTWSPAGTVAAYASTGSTATDVSYNFAITKNGPQRFYRLSARNWLGDSSAP
ncbi:MAG: fibronectin type III domain-containing protein [Verrucomicrobiaceae bacterium]|nr:MAG: fibronectin type III domain-containing protein [Verrucomicrobiaceae bacterium]